MIPVLRGTILLLDSLRTTLMLLGAEYVLQPKDAPINKEDALKFLFSIEFNIKGFELTESLKLVEFIKRKVEQSSDEFPVYVPEYTQLITELERRIDDELDNITFGFIPYEKTKYFESDKLFGDEVYDCFKLARQDIKDAGTCFASELYTASVFHLMRAVEVGAKSLVKAMKAEKYITTPVIVRGVKKMVKKPVELCDWGTLIKGMESAINNLEKGSKISTKKKETLAYYNHAVGVFRNFKDAWRNYVAHSRKTYREFEARDIMDNARQFMQHLSQRVKE